MSPYFKHQRAIIEAILSAIPLGHRVGNEKLFALNYPSEIPEGDFYIFEKEAFRTAHFVFIFPYRVRIPARVIAKVELTFDNPQQPSIIVNMYGLDLDRIGQNITDIIQMAGYDTMLIVEDRTVQEWTDVL